LREDVLQIRLPLACRRPCCRAHSRDVWQGYRSCDGRADTPKKCAPASARAASLPGAQAHARTAARAADPAREEGAHQAAGVAGRPAAVARVLLHGGRADAQFPPHGRQPHLPPDPLGRQRGPLPRLGRGAHGRAPGPPRHGGAPAAASISFCLENPVPSAGWACGVHGPCLLGFIQIAEKGSKDPACRTLHACVLGRVFPTPAVVIGPGASRVCECEPDGRGCCVAGYPWIDAIMMQLRTQGWMHHLARHCVVRPRCLPLAAGQGRRSPGEPARSLMRARWCA